MFTLFSPFFNHSNKKMKFRNDQYKLIFNAVRRYQIEKCVHDSKEYWECNSILDELFDVVYTQNQEQPT